MFEIRPDLTLDLIHWLGWAWLFLAVLNVGWTVFLWRSSGKRKGEAGQGTTNWKAAVFWGVFAAGMLTVAVWHLGWSGQAVERFPVKLPESFKQAVDEWLCNPVAYFVCWVCGLFVLLRWRSFFVRPNVAWSLFNFLLIFFLLSLTDWDFRQLVSKPDNIAIVGMFFLVFFFTWLYLFRAERNDRRLARGEKTLEEEESERELVWPKLVYIELICMVLVTAILLWWALAVPAPLEQPASRTSTPNPAKAPWYFLGLQELLVYFDPWLAGVVFPSLIIFGLMAIPYLDPNRKGSGYSTFSERPLAVSTFLFGFLVLWISLIGLGTFLRGPNWTFFGIYERWDVHKVTVLNNVNLSDLVYRQLGKVFPSLNAVSAHSADAHGLRRFGYVLLREAPGLLLLAFYFGVLPFLLSRTLLKTQRQEMGTVRFWIFVFLFLGMLLLPLKMILRWAFNVKYIVAVPEWWLNI